jgi:hypothetical protein
MSNNNLSLVTFGEDDTFNVCVINAYGLYLHTAGIFSLICIHDTKYVLLTLVYEPLGMYMY